MFANQALKPITWVEMQDLLDQLGFQLLALDQTKGTARFGPKDLSKAAPLKSPIAIALPDFVAADGRTPAYERDYVVDLINQIFGGNGGKVLASFLAKK